MKLFIRLGTIIAIVTVLLSCRQNSSQDVITFDEPEAPQFVSPVQQWEKLNGGVQVAWGSSNERYHREYIPVTGNKENIVCTGWKNERVYAQLVAWSNDSVPALSVQVSDLKSGKDVIKAEAIKPFFVRNVITDEFLGGCGYKTKKQETAHLVADCLEEAPALYMREKSTRGVWFNIDIPADVPAGSYTGKVSVMAQGKKVKDLSLSVNVLDMHLPDPANWQYHLDLWQNPYAVARMHNVELWSDKHFEYMKPLYKMLANAGQKCITASIIHKPWGGQTYDHFESMVKHTLKADGTWEFDYSIFDKWISFMMDLGIKEQINCYTMVPWGNKFYYFDEKLVRDTSFTAKPATEKYAWYWAPFLEDFTTHLNEKGWLEITAIAMDERPQEEMDGALKLIAQHSKLKVASAANYSAGLSEQIYDLCVALRHVPSENNIEERREKGQKTTFYVCCSEDRPNNFTFSPPAEGVWQGWFSYAKKLDGMLRWAYNSWVEDPVQDSRFRTWPGGDTFFVYPGAKSSIRFEKVREGIQDYEKLKILTQKLQKCDDEKAREHLEKIEDVLNGFNAEKIKEDGALKQVLKAKEVLKYQL
ncbi:DUF6067 family protein [Prolixibacteraceae bacterium Z1-6]|uniref:DUF6067 family protein n=1 Tax=Draconibacterium aestuarii TaxID=2998507 RepID=A0A9X3F2H9_9BACT|nr:DUF6067 family protein [Prolixibacteraceae bacterium Z1-6]